METSELLIYRCEKCGRVLSLGENIIPQTGYCTKCCKIVWTVKENLMAVGE